MLVSEAIRTNWPNYDVTINCPEDCEGHFSWSQCNGCGSRLGGERHPIAARCLHPNHFGLIDDLTACVDCLDYLANGVDHEVA